MSHPFITQLHFSRSEFKRALEGLSDDDARKRIGVMNCISWNIGHLAAQEQRYWLTSMQENPLMPELEARFGYGSPASTPSLDEVWNAWNEITQVCEILSRETTCLQLLSSKVNQPERTSELCYNARYITTGTTPERTQPSDRC